jgi:DNA mismatch repair protein MSH4
VAASLKFDNRRMYWFRIPTADLDIESIPPEFINVIPKKKHIECQTLDLVKLNQRLLDTSNEIIMRSDAAIRDLVKELRRQVPPLFRVCESIALVDMISSFGQVTTTRDYVRPGIEDTLALKAARHPILDKVTRYWETLPAFYRLNLAIYREWRANTCPMITMPVNIIVFIVSRGAT